MVWLTARNGQRHAADLARMEENRQIRSEVQTRLADAYIDLLAQLEEQGLWAQSLLLLSSGYTSSQKRPSNEAQFSVRAKVFGYGSEAVKKKVQEYWEQLWDFAELELASRKSEPWPAGDRKRFIEEYAPREDRLRKEIRELVAKELRYPDVK